MATTTDTFDAHGDLATQTTHGTDGNTYYTDFNLQHAQNWQYAVATYDPEGSTAFNIIKQNDNTGLVTAYGPRGVHGWKDAKTGDNATGAIDHGANTSTARNNTPFMITPVIFQPLPSTTIMPPIT